MTADHLHRRDPVSGPPTKGHMGRIESMSDAEIDRRLEEHAGFDHQGVWRRCVQDVHFCIEDYGPPIAPEGTR